MSLHSPTKKKYTTEEKAQLLANLDLEVSHRVRQFEEWLADALENFRTHQEGLILRVPRLVRDVTLRDFAKYNGDIQECLKGIQRERLGGENGATTIDRTTRKRKWVESQEAEGRAAADAAETESTKAMKSARMMMATPKKAGGTSNAPGTAQRSRLPITNTPGTIRTTQRRPPSRAPSPSPRKPMRQGSKGKPLAFPRSAIAGPSSPKKPASPSKLPSRPPSPSKPGQVRVPSSSMFNPSLPDAQPRWPRKDENMLSVNGSPIANPYQLGFSFNFASSWSLDDLNEENEEVEVTEEEGKLKAPRTLRRTNSIIVRSVSNSSIGGGHSRSGSQASIAPSHSHSRANSQSTLNSSGGFMPTRNIPGSSSSQHIPPSSSKTSTHSRSNSNSQQTPRNLSSTIALPPAAAIVAVPTKDGHVLEFDPLQTSPDEIDALEGITDSAKKQAKDDIARLVLKAVERWKIK
ncbi:hypothetical protein K474DRAFT_1656319 [Panus rudis PR-1116 ss-1]|nr:hypothetical protein K474DRAFT_1656319 [Panus rudis PR-1116 ss-1]